MHGVLARAIDEVRQKREPRFVECRTYRYAEHVGIGDDHDAGYRCAAAATAWKARDPLCTDTALRERLEPAIRAEIDAAVEFAESSPWPSPDSLLADVA